MRRNAPAALLGVACLWAFLYGQIGCSMPPRRPDQSVLRDEAVVDADEAGLQSSAAKITYLDNQTTPIPTVIIHTKDFQVAPEIFLSLQGTTIPYSNDEEPQEALQAEVSAREISKMLAAVKPIIGRSPAANRRPEHISFDVIRKSDRALAGCEYSVKRDVAERFFLGLLSGLDKNDSRGLEVLTYQFDGVVPPSSRMKP